MGNEQLFENALKAQDSMSALSEVAFALHKQGLNREEIGQAFVNYALILRKQNREKEEDKILDMTDFILGFCSPHQLISGLD